jgi:2-polyprenyl-3-methyl-5-hydroxy-6-metoxy-1,4-benzoquinol methylase
MPPTSPAPWLASDRKEPRYYNGLRIKADTGLHEQLEAIIGRLVPLPPAPPDAADEWNETPRPRIIDLGCGEGALAQRLHDLGYDVIAADIDQQSFQAVGPKFVPLDLHDAAAVERFVYQEGRDAALVLAVEVIEHLRDPWALLAACRRLCGADARLIVTTPNVASWWGRLWFLLTGQLWGFQPESWLDPGHINPLTETEMRGILADSGFRLLEVQPVGCLPVIWTYNWKRLLASLAMLPLRPLMRGPKDGWALCFVAQSTPLPATVESTSAEQSP